MNRWRSIIQSSFRNNLDPGNEESNALLKGILDSDDEKLAGMCFGRVGNVKWEVEYSMSKTIRERFGSAIQNQRSGFLSLDGSSTTDGSDAHLLYQMFPLTKVDLPWRMGFVPMQALQGDLICWASGIWNAILVRLFDGSSYREEISAQVLGTAVVSEDVAGASFDHENRFSRPAQASREWSGYSERILDFPIKVDAWTLFTMLAK